MRTYPVNLPQKGFVFSVFVMIGRPEACEPSIAPVTKNISANASHVTNFSH